MRLNFLGTGSAYNPSLKNTSAFFIEGNVLYLLDCGETVFEELYSSGILEQCDRIVTAITHFHSDHFGSLGSMTSYCYCKLGKKITIIFPDSSIRTLLQSTGVPDVMYDHVPLLRGAVEILPCPVRHDPTIRCYGYLLRTADDAIFYGGDSVAIPPEMLLALEKGSLSAIYQDMTSPRVSTGGCHGSLEALCKQVRPELRRKVFGMHFDHDFTSQVLNAGFSLAAPQFFQKERGRKQTWIIEGKANQIS